ncbi:MAG: SxtJ family membrane protein [Gammaproteobacteria bacterium]
MNGKVNHKQAGGTHEHLEDRTEVTLGSEKSFGIVFAVVFLIIGLLPLIAAHSPLYWSFGISAVFLAAAFFAPWALAPLNRLWFRFGLLLHAIINPLIMGLIFYLVVTPTGLVMRRLGKDLLRLKFDPKAESYWIKRDPPGPARDSFNNQF